MQPANWRTNEEGNNKKKQSATANSEKKSFEIIIGNRLEVAHEMHANMKKWIINWEFLSFLLCHIKTINSYLS